MLRYWRDRAKESFVKARVLSEAAIFVLFLVGGLVVLKSPNFPIDT